MTDYATACHLAAICARRLAATVDYVDPANPIQLAEVYAILRHVLEDCKHTECVVRVLPITLDAATIAEIAERLIDVLAREGKPISLERDDLLFTIFRTELSRPDSPLASASRDPEWMGYGTPTAAAG